MKKAVLSILSLFFVLSPLLGIFNGEKVEASTTPPDPQSWYYQPQGESSASTTYEMIREGYKKFVLHSKSFYLDRGETKGTQQWRYKSANSTNLLFLETRSESDKSLDNGENIKGWSVMFQSTSNCPSDTKVGKIGTFEGCRIVVTQIDGTTAKDIVAIAEYFSSDKMDQSMLVSAYRLASSQETVIAKMASKPLSSSVIECTDTQGLLLKPWTLDETSARKDLAEWQKLFLEGKSGQEGQAVNVSDEEKAMIEKVIANFDITGSEMKSWDKTLYQTFYNSSYDGTNASTIRYPNIRLDASTQQKLNDFHSTVARQNKVLVNNGIFYFIWQKVDERDYERFIKGAVLLKIAAKYIKANNDYQKCLQSQNDPYGLPNDSLVSSSENISGSFDGNMGRVEAESPLCGKPPAWGLRFTNIKYAICAAIEVTLYNFGKWLLDVSGNALGKVLGITSGTNQKPELYGIEIVPVHRVLANTKSGTGQSVLEVWETIMKLINSLLVIVLFIIAFAEILRININTYGFKKLLPSLIMAIIAANFSFVICRIIVDIPNILMTLIIQYGDNPGNIVKSALTEAVTKSGGVKADPLGEGQPRVIWPLFISLYSIAAGIIIYILAFLFFIRNWVIYFFTAVSSLAFMSIVLPQTKSLFNQWWSQFIKWAFMPIVSLFILWLGATFVSVFESEPWLGATVAIACLLAAIQVPFKMGGVIMQKWGNLGKNVWNKTGGAGLGFVTSGGALSAYQAYAQKKMKTAARIGDEKARKRWERESNVAGVLNPQTYKKGISERLASARSTSEKAVFKTDRYGSIAGPARQIQAFFDANKDDDLGAPGYDIGQRAKGNIDKIINSENNKLKRWVNHVRDEVKEKDQRYISAKTEDKGKVLEQITREKLLNEIRTTNDPALADLFSNTELDVKFVGETKSIANAFNRVNARQQRERDSAFNASGDVGQFGINPASIQLGNGAAVELGDIANKYSGDKVEHLLAQIVTILEHNSKGISPEEISLRANAAIGSLKDGDLSGAQDFYKKFIGRDMLDTDAKDSQKIESVLSEYAESANHALGFRNEYISGGRQGVETAIRERASVGAGRETVQRVLESNPNESAEGIINALEKIGEKIDANSPTKLADEFKKVITNRASGRVDTSDFLSRGRTRVEIDDKTIARLSREIATQNQKATKISSQNNLTKPPTPPTAPPKNL